MVRRWKSVLGGLSVTLFFFAAFNSATVAWVHGLGVGAFSTLTLGAGAATATSITQSGTGNFLVTLGGSTSIMNFRDSVGSSMLQLVGGTTDIISTKKELSLQPTTVVTGAGNTGNSAILLGQSYTGTWSGSGALTLGMGLIVPDNVNAGIGNGVELISATLTSGGAATVGARHVGDFIFQLSTTSANTPTNPGTYTGINAKCIINANDNGTALSTGNVSGTCFGQNLVVTTNNGATNLNAIVGNEIDVEAKTGSSMLDKAGVLVDEITDDAVQGTRDDIGLAFDAQSGAAVGWKYLISFGRQGGFDPCGATCTLIGTMNHLASGTIAATNGVDFTNATFSGNAFMSNAFSVTQAGLVTGSAYSVGATAGVDCSGVTAGTVVVTKGLVTHC